MKFSKSHPARGQPASQPASQPCSLGLSILRTSKLEGSAAEAAAFKYYSEPWHLHVWRKWERREVEDSAMKQS